MLTRATLKPGQKGTRRLVDKYGDRLLCVRYKYDERQRRRYTTVELIEHGSDWTPQPAADTLTSPSGGRRLAVRIEYWETELRQKAKTAGGIWRPRQKVWELGYADVVALGLESRVVPADPGGSE